MLVGSEGYLVFCGRWRRRTSNYFRGPHSAPNVTLVLNSISLSKVLCTIIPLIPTVHSLYTW